MRHSVILTLVTFILASCNGHLSLEKADQLREESFKSIQDKEFVVATFLAKEALEMYQSFSDSSGMAEVNYLLARASALSGDFDAAIVYGEFGAKLSRAIKDYGLEYKLNNTLSWAYFVQGRGFAQTMDHQKRQLLVVDKLNDDKAKALVYNNYGYDATVSGSIRLVEAISYSEWANDYYAEAENSNGRWYTLMNLTWQHRLINNLSKSEEYGYMSVEQAKADDDRHAIIEAITNLGETLLIQNKLMEAKPLYELGLGVSRRKPDRDRYVFDTYYSNYLWSIGRRNEAIATLKNAIDFLVDSEIFYEMLARAFLMRYSYIQGDLLETRNQIAHFKNPRANYFSQESRILASMTEAQLLFDNDKLQAIRILDDGLEQLNKSGATLLITKVLTLKNQMLQR